MNLLAEEIASIISHEAPDFDRTLHVDLPVAPDDGYYMTRDSFERVRRFRHLARDQPDVRRTGRPVGAEAWTLAGFRRNRRCSSNSVPDATVDGGRIAAASRRISIRRSKSS